MLRVRNTGPHCALVLCLSLSRISRQHSLEQAENLIKQHEAFITTMDANDEKINNVLQFAQRLIDENHYAADKVQQKAESINERSESLRF